MTYSTETTYTVDFPRIVDAPDYHDFEYMEHVLRKVIHPSLKMEEIGYSPTTRRYYAVAYSALNAVNDEEIREMLKQINVVDLNTEKYRLVEAAE